MACPHLFPKQTLNLARTAVHKGMSTLFAENLLPKTATLYPETGDFVAFSGDFVAVFGNKCGQAISHLFAAMYRYATLCDSRSKITVLY